MTFTSIYVPMSFLFLLHAAAMLLLPFCPLIFLSSSIFFFLLLPSLQPLLHLPLSSLPLRSHTFLFRSALFAFFLFLLSLFSVFSMCTFSFRFSFAFALDVKTNSDRLFSSIFQLHPITCSLIRTDAKTLCRCRCRRRHASLWPECDRVSGDAVFFSFPTFSVNKSFALERVREEKDCEGFSSENV